MGYMMIEIDEITIVVGVAVLVVAAVAPFVNIFFRRPVVERTTDDNEGSGCVADAVENDTLPPVSIVLTPYENSEALEKSLPLFLGQKYSPGFQIVVVTSKGDSEIEDVIKRYSDNPNLYSTYIPNSSRYVSRKKLAVTLGVKAAKNEWVVLTDAECCPNSELWLATMAANCTEHIDMVIGHTSYEESTPAYRCFERMLDEMYLFREGQLGTAYRTNGNNLMFRKSMFVAGDGYRGNLKFTRGEYDFLVNKYSKAGNVAIETHPHSWMTELEPTDKSWLDKHLHYMANRKHMLRSLSHRLPYNIDQCLLHGNLLLIMAAIIYGAITQKWIIVAVASVALLFTISIRPWLSARALKEFEVEIGKVKLLFFEYIVMWKKLACLVKYHKTDKNDFMTHKV